MRLNADLRQLRIGYLDALRILVLVQFGTDLEARIGGRRGDQLNDGAVAAQRFAPPIDGDEREQAVLDLVPFAGARRQMAYRDGTSQLIGELLQFNLPEAYAVAVTASAIGRDHQACGTGMARLTHGLPPAADRLYREAGRIVIGTDAHPAQIVVDVVDPVGNRPGRKGTLTV